MNETRTEATSLPHASAAGATEEDITLTPFQSKRADESDAEFDQRLAEWWQKVCVKYQAWRDKPVVEKIVQLVALLKSLEIGRAHV